MTRMNPTPLSPLTLSTTKPLVLQMSLILPRRSLISFSSSIDVYIHFSRKLSPRYFPPWPLIISRMTDKLRVKLGKLSFQWLTENSRRPGNVRWIVISCSGSSWKHSICKHWIVFGSKSNRENRLEESSIETRCNCFNFINSCSGSMEKNSGFSSVYKILAFL